MGRKTSKTPSADDSFLWRICHALDEHPSTLAENIGVPYKELKPLLNKTKSRIADPDYEEVWWKLNEYVSKRIGSLMATKYELNKMLQDARVRKVKQHQRQKAYHERR